MHCWNQTQVKPCSNVPKTPEINQLILLILQYLTRCTNFLLTTIFNHNKSSHSLMSIMTLGQFLQNATHFIFYHCLDIRNKNFDSALLCDARPSRASIKDATRWRGSELQRKSFCSTKFDGMDLDIGTCFPIHVVVFVSLKVSFGLNFDSKSNFSIFLKNFPSLVYLTVKESSLSKSFLDLMYLPGIKIFHSFTAGS